MAITFEIAPPVIALEYLGIYPAIVCASASFLALSFTHWYKKSIVTSEKRNDEYKLFQSALAFAPHSSSEHMSTQFSILEDASQFAALHKESETGNALKSILARMLFGENLNQATAHIEVAQNPYLTKELRRLSMDYASTGSIFTACSNLSKSINEKLVSTKDNAVAEEQKYLTILTAFDTMAPSFLLFAFMGYSMLHYSNVSILVMMLVLTIALPTASDLLRLKIRRCNGV